LYRYKCAGNSHADNKDTPFDYNSVTELLEHLVWSFAGWTDDVYFRPQRKAIGREILRCHSSFGREKVSSSQIYCGVAVRILRHLVYNQGTTALL